jgi:hypothetical protein
MNIVRLALEIFALYLLYKLIFDFIIPVAKTTKQVKKQFSDMSAQMRDKMNQQENSYNTTSVNTGKTTDKQTGKHDDYIEFEEVKK